MYDSPYGLVLMKISQMKVLMGRSLAGELGGGGGVPLALVTHRSTHAVQLVKD